MLIYQYFYAPAREVISPAAKSFAAYAMDFISEL